MSEAQEPNGRLGAKYASDLPRKWEKLDEAQFTKSLSFENMDPRAVRDIFNDDSHLDEEMKEVFEEHEYLGEFSEEEAQDLIRTFKQLVSTSEKDVYRRFLYDGTECQERPSEIIIVARDEHDYTMEAFKLREPKLSTRKNEGIDDRIDDVEVLYQITSGEEGAYAHGTNRGGEQNRELGNLDTFFKKIFKGHDVGDWKEHKDTGFWKSDIEPSPVHLAHAIPDQIDDPMLERFQESIYKFRYDDDISDYNLKSKNYDRIQSETGISQQGMEEIMEYAEKRAHNMVKQKIEEI